MMHIELSLIGGFSLTIDGAPRELPVRKSQLVLARLALASRRAVPRHDLRQMFWELSDETQAQVSLRQALARIRKALGPAADLLTSDMDIVGLDHAIEIDVARLDKTGAQSNGFEEALVTGELLAGQSPREPAASNWLAGERSRLRLKQTQYCRAEAERCLDAGSADAALQAGLKGLLLDNLDEALHVAVMRAYGALGNRSAALDQYRQCEMLLSQELGVAPEASTKEIANRLRTRERPSAIAAPQPDLSVPSETSDIRLASVLCVGHGRSDDPEDYGALPTALMNSLGRLAAEHGADLVPGDGSEAFLVLGASTASEHDSARASSLAHELLAAHPQLRAGLAWGRVVVTRHPGGNIRINGEPRAHALALMNEAPRGRFVHAPQTLACRPAPVFVGREVELGYLQALFARCRDGTPTVAVIQGEPGIGKSRLTGAFVDALHDQGMEVLRIGFEPFGQTIGAAEALCRSAVEAGGGLPDTAGLAAQALFAEMTGIDLPEGGASQISAMSWERRNALGLSIIRDLLKAIPVHAAAIVVEDAHWAQLADLEFLVSVANDLPGLRAMMVVTERVSTAQFAPIMTARPSETTVSTLALAPFSVRDGLALARGMGITDDDLVELAVTRSKGNPLFLACLLETGRNSDGRLPPTIVSLVQEQMDLLPPEPRQRLRQAAVLGASFNPAHFTAIYGPVSWGDLIAAGCLYRNQDRLVFPHALVHESVYGTITRADRHSYHSAAAKFFAEADPVLWADHALAADLPEAARACSDAADMLLPRHEFERGLKYITVGLDRAQTVEEKALLHIARGSIDRERGRLTEALEDYEAASGPEVPARVRIQALVRRAWVHRLRAEADVADRVLAEATALDHDALPPDQLSEYENQLGAQAFVRGDVEACAHHNRRALDLATTPLHRSRALGGLGDALYAAGRMFSAYRTFRECNALAREHGLGVVELSHLMMEADALHFADPGPQARDLLELVLERSRDAGNARVEIMGLITLAELYLEDGLYHKCEAAVREGQEVMDRIGAERFSSWQIRCLTLSLAALENREAARLLMHDWLSQTRANAPDRVRGEHYAALALMTDDTEQALSALTKGREITEKEARFTQFWYHRMAIDTALRLRRFDIVGELTEALRTMTAPEPLGWTGLVIDRANLLVDAHTKGLSDTMCQKAWDLRQRLIACQQQSLLPGLEQVFGSGA